MTNNGEHSNKKNVQKGKEEKKKKEKAHYNTNILKRFSSL